MDTQGKWIYDQYFDWTATKFHTFVRVNGRMRAKDLWWVLEFFPSWIRYSGWIES